MAPRPARLPAPPAGVNNIPECLDDGEPSLYCQIMQKLLGMGAYNTWVQRHVVQAQYFKVGGQVATSTLIYSFPPPDISCRESP